MIFFVEGIISMGVGAICWFFMSDRPSACKWLTPEERELAEFRLVAEQPGQHEAIDALHSKAVWAGIFNTNTIGEPSGRDSFGAFGVLTFAILSHRVRFPPEQHYGSGRRLLPGACELSP